MWVFFLFFFFFFGGGGGGVGGGCSVHPIFLSLAFLFLIALIMKVFVFLDDPVLLSGR